VVIDIDVHQLNLRPLRSLQFLAENPFKKCVFLHFLSNKCIINSFFGKKITLKKGKYLMGGHCIIFSFFFGLVMCHKPQI
jgi:hypothetical protein